MISKVYSATSIGCEGKIIEVECDASNGLPGLLIVGLGNKSIDESKERIRSAIKNTGLDFPKKRITINLAPANLPKNGSQFDLPMAISILIISGQVYQEVVKSTLFAGELALDGALRPISGAINYAEIAKKTNLKNIILPSINCAQASIVDGINILPAANLADIISHLKNTKTILPFLADNNQRDELSDNLVRIDDIKGQDQAKRALLIAASGRHNLLLTGPPGSGKTMLAKAALSILPPLNTTESIEVTKLYSLAGENYESVITKRPFRSPHHSASHVALSGGGAFPRPGEISLAHHGILFLDELPEYSRQALETLRQPLEDKQITIARVNNTMRFPANFMLIATQNPCPCGYAYDPEHKCICTSQQINNYNKKISGPLLDRIDMVVEVNRVDPGLLLQKNTITTNGPHFCNVQQVLGIQEKRFNSQIKRNSDMSSKEALTLANIDKDASNLLEKAAKSLSLSARSCFKVIKVARTIADLDSKNIILTAHIAEALQYRPRNT